MTRWSLLGMVSGYTVACYNEVVNIMHTKNMEETLWHIFYAIHCVIESARADTSQNEIFGYCKGSVGTNVSIFFPTIIPYTNRHDAWSNGTLWGGVGRGQIYTAGTGSSQLHQDLHVPGWEASPGCLQWP